MRVGVPKCLLSSSPLLAEALMEALQAGSRVSGSSGTRLPMLIAVATTLTTTSVDGLRAGLFVKKGALHPGSGGRGEQVLTGGM